MDDSPALAVSAPSAAGAATQLLAVLFDADGTDRTLDESQIDKTGIGDRQLMWVDIDEAAPGEATALLQRLFPRLGFEDGALPAFQALNGQARLQNFGDWFLAHAVAVTHAGELKFEGHGLAIAAGRNVVVTLHRGPLQPLEQLRGREQADTRLGVLSAESFTASLLDWQLASYFDAVTHFEATVDRLEVALLAGGTMRPCLPELALLRRGASRLRRMLAPHRNLFNALARPDFRPDADGDANAHFHALDARFGQAMDAVENARDLVVGSFELFATRTAQRTNETMRVLTVFTVLIGSLAVLAGVLGMNFPAPFFQSGARGFWLAVSGMGAIVITVLLLARWRRWL